MYARRGCCCGKSIYPWCFYRGSCDNMYDVYLLPESIARTIQEEPGDPRDKLDFLYGGTDHSKAIKFRWSANSTFNAKITDNLLNGSVVHQPAVEYTLYSYHEDVGNRPEVTQECTQLCEDAGRVPPILGGGPDFLIYDTCYESFLKTYDDSMANGRSVGDVLGEHSYIGNVNNWYVSGSGFRKHSIENIFRGLTTEYPFGEQFRGEYGDRTIPITAGTFDARWEYITSYIPENVRHTKEKGAWDVEMDPIFCMYGENSIYREKIAYYDYPPTGSDLSDEEYEAVIRGITTETNDWIDADEVYRNNPPKRSKKYPNEGVDEPGYLKYRYFNGGYRSANGQFSRGWSNEYFRTQGADVLGACAGDGTRPTVYASSPEKGGDVSPLYGIYYGQNQAVGPWHSWIGGLEQLAADVEMFNPDTVTWDYKFPQYQVAKYTTPGSVCICPTSSEYCNPIRDYIETGFCTAQDRISTYSWPNERPPAEESAQPIGGFTFENVAFDKEHWPGRGIDGRYLDSNTPSRNSYFKDLRNGIGTITNADPMPAIPTNNFFTPNTGVFGNNPQEFGNWYYTGLEEPQVEYCGYFGGDDCDTQPVTGYRYTLEQKQKAYRLVDTVTDNGEFVTVMDVDTPFEGSWTRQIGDYVNYYVNQVGGGRSDSIPSSIPDTPPGGIKYDITEAGASISCGPIFNEGHEQGTRGGRPLFGAHGVLGMGSAGFGAGQGIAGSGQDPDEYPYWRIIPGVSNVYTLDELGIDNPQYEVLLKDAYTSVNWVPGMTYGAKTIVDTDITIGVGYRGDRKNSPFYMDNITIPTEQEEKAVWEMDNADIFSPGMWNGLYCGIGIKGNLKPAASLLTQGKIQSLPGYGGACNCESIPGSNRPCCSCFGFISDGCVSVYGADGNEECLPRVCGHNPDKQIAVLPNIWVPASIIPDWNWEQSVSYTYDQNTDDDNWTQYDKTWRRTTIALDTRTVGGRQYVLAESRFAVSTTVTSSESGAPGDFEQTCYQWYGENGEGPYETCYIVWEDDEPPNVETDTCTQTGVAIIGGFTTLDTAEPIHVQTGTYQGDQVGGRHPYRRITIPLRWMDLGFHETPFKDTANIYVSNKEEQKCMESRAYAKENKEIAEGIQNNKIFEYAGITGASCGVVCPENIKFYDFPYKGDVGLYGTKKYEFKPEYQNYLDWLITNNDIQNPFKEWAAATIARQRTVSKLFYWPKDFADRITVSPASHIFGLNSGMTEWKTGWSVPPYPETAGINKRNTRRGPLDDDEDAAFYYQHDRILSGVTIDVPLIGSVSQMYITWEEKPQIVQVCELQDNSGFGSEAEDSLVPLFVRRERTSGITSSGLPYPNVIGNLPSGVASDDQVYRNFILGRKTEFTDPNEYVPYPEEGFSDVYRNEYHGLWANWGYAGKIKNDPREYRFDRNYPKDLRRIPRFDVYGEENRHTMYNRASSNSEDYIYNNWSQLPSREEDPNASFTEEQLRRRRYQTNKWVALYYDEGALGVETTRLFDEGVCPSGATMGLRQYKRGFDNGVAYHWAVARMSNRSDVPQGRHWADRIDTNLNDCPEEIINSRQYIYQNTFYGQPESVRGWTASDYPWLTGFTMGIDPDINWCSTTPKADPEFYEE